MGGLTMVEACPARGRAPWSLPLYRRPSIEGGLHANIRPIPWDNPVRYARLPMSLFANGEPMPNRCPVSPALLRTHTSYGERSSRFPGKGGLGSPDRNTGAEVPDAQAADRSGTRKR